MQKDVEADTIRTLLESAGYTVFFDTKLVPGDEAAKRMMHAAETAKVGVALLTTDFVSSMWPMKELQILAKHRRLLPLFYNVTPDNCQNPPPSWIDFAAKVRRFGLNLTPTTVSVMCD